MKKLNYRQRLLASTLLVGASALASPALAQDVQPPVPDQNSNPAAAQPTGPQEAAPPPTRNAQGAPVQTGNDIIITGTRIPQPNLTSAAPITVVTNQDIKLTGSTRVEDVLNQLPSVGASMTSSMSNGATGTAEVDLRYLGSKRTLSLVNGRRMTPGDPAGASQAADINLIPGSLIKRVDVLTGGASSVYGADAVAGVVNFIMDTSFTGIRFDGQYSFYQHGNDCPGIPTSSALGGNVCGALDARAATTAGFSYPRGSVADGGIFDGTVALGAAFDDNRGHAMAYFGYRKVNAILQQRRDYSACGLSGAGNITCGGSATSAEGNVLVFSDNTSTFYTFGPNRTLTPGRTLYNFNPTNYYQRPDERYIAGAFADYEVSKAIHPYMEFMFMDDHTLAQIAPSGDFGNTFTINCDNPLMSAQAQSIVCAPGQGVINGFLGAFPLAQGAAYNPNPAAPPVVLTDAQGTQYNIGYFNLLRRNVEGGPRISDLKHTSWRGVLGSRGDLSKVWSYDAYFQYGRTDYEQVFRNEFSTARLNRALNVTIDQRSGSPTFGQPVCRSVLDQTDPNCVPYDIFSTPSAAAVNYLNVYGVMTGQTSEQIADANITGALGEMGIQTPWSDQGVGVNLGTEYRRESLTLNPDQEFQTGDLTGQGAPTLPVNGGFRVLEAFGEVQIPIVRHSFIDELSLAAGYRKSWYTTLPGPGLVDLSGNPVVSRKYDTDTYKLSVEFAPIHDVRFRGAYNRAVRAPNIQELFSPQFVGLDGGTDPCAGHAIQANEYGCIAQGLVPDPDGAGPLQGQTTPLNPAEQYNGFIGGNPALNPEKATTKTVGVVLQPRFIPRLAISVDYWDIRLKGAIQGFGADTILSDCVANTTSLTNVAPSCALIHRNPAGSLWLSPQGYVIDLANNVGGIKTNGIDVNASYSYRLGSIGNLSASFIGTYLRKYITDNGLADPYDCAGFYGTVCSGAGVSSSAPIPHWRHKLRATLQLPVGIGVSAQWRYVGKVRHEHLSPDDALAGAVPVLGAHIKGQSYFDLASTFTIGDHYNFRLGVNNVFDKNPPLVTASVGSCPAGPCNGKTYPGTWDALGRYIYAAATLNF
jgi:outer membrane receptor protein involved in Fe transport